MSHRNDRFDPQGIEACREVLAEEGIAFRDGE